MNFKVGDRVKYISGRYTESEYNPLWGGIYGKKVGEVIRITFNRITVKWSGPRVNGYDDDDLKLVGSINCPAIIIKEW